MSLSLSLLVQFVSTWNCAAPHTNCASYSLSLALMPSSCAAAGACVPAQGTGQHRGASCGLCFTHCLRQQVTYQGKLTTPSGVAWPAHATKPGWSTQGHSTAFLRTPAPHSSALRCLLDVGSSSHCQDSRCVLQIFLCNPKSPQKPPHHSMLPRATAAASYVEVHWHSCMQSATPACAPRQGCFPSGLPDSSSA